MRAEPEGSSTAWRLPILVSQAWTELPVSTSGLHVGAPERRYRATDICTSLDGSVFVGAVAMPDVEREAQGEGRRAARPAPRLMYRQPQRGLAGRATCSGSSTCCRTPSSPPSGPRPATA